MGMSEVLKGLILLSCISLYIRNSFFSFPRQRTIFGNHGKYRPFVSEAGRTCSQSAVEKHSDSVAWGVQRLLS